MMQMFRFKPKTADDVLAKNLREAVAAFNSAYKAAEQAGLTVSVHNCFASGRLSEPIWDGIKLTGVYRVNTESF